MVELQSGDKIKAARSENLSGLLKVITKWKVEQGAQIESTTIITSNQNGPVEYYNKSCETGMRALLKDSELPLEFWDESVETDVHTRNRTQTERLIDGVKIGPEEAFTGIRPEISDNSISNSKFISYSNSSTIAKGLRTSKFIDRRSIGVFIGDSETTNKNFRVYNQELGYTSRTS